MKVKDVKHDIEKAMKEVNFTKIDNHTQFHDRMHAILDQVLPTGFRFSTWEVTFGDDYEAKVFSYNRDFYKYKSCRWADKGRFSNVRIELVEPIADLELSQLEAYFAEKRNNKEIKSATEHVAKLRDELALAEARLVSLQMRASDKVAV